MAKTFDSFSPTLRSKYKVWGEFSKGCLPVERDSKGAQQFGGSVTPPTQSGG